MRRSFENMQRGAAASEHAGSGFDRGARAGCRDNQSENGDALSSSARRRLLRERGTSQDAVRKMKVAEPIDIEFLQAERLQNFFVFHFRRPIREVVGHPATTGECRTVEYFCGLSRKCSCERNGKLTDGASAGLAETQPGRTALTPRMRKQIRGNGNWRGENDAIDRLAGRTFASAAGTTQERHLLFQSRRRDQREIQNHLFPQRRARARHANGACRSGAAQGL
jgi:hypothetical protein